MDQRTRPRYKNREKIGILAPEDKKLLFEAQSVDVSSKGVRFESGAELAPEQNYYIVFGYMKYGKLEVLAQVLAKYVKDGKQCYSAKFLDEDLMQKTRIRNYVEKVRGGHAF